MNTEKVLKCEWDEEIKSLTPEEVNKTVDEIIQVCASREVTHSEMHNIFKFLKVIQPYPLKSFNEKMIQGKSHLIFLACLKEDDVNEDSLLDTIFAEMGFSKKQIDKAVETCHVNIKKIEKEKHGH